MKTACPHCDSLLTLIEEQIQQRQGMVRCGVCRQVFNALEHLVEDDYPILQEDDAPVLMPSQPAPSPSPVSIPAPAQTPMPASASNPLFARRQAGAPALAPDRTSSAPSSAPSGATPTSVHIHLNQAAMAPGASKSNVTHEISAHPQQDVYEDAHYIDQVSARRSAKEASFSIQSDSSYEEDYNDYVPSRSGGGGLYWFFLVLVAIALFAGQFMYVFRNQISTILPSSRPLLIQMCGFLNCDLGFSKSIEDLELSQVNVGLDSSLKPNAGEQGLRLQANLLNKGAVASEWPSLVLTLKNATGSVSNRKVIEPRQYVLPEMLMQYFQPGAQVTINLPFILSGDPVSNYEVGLFFP